MSEPTDAWLVQAANVLGVDQVDESQVFEILGVARDVAHDVERRLTPVATFLLGAATQRRIGYGATGADAFTDAVSALRSALPGAAPEA